MPAYTIQDFKRNHPDAVRVRRDANNTIRAWYPDGKETVTLHNTAVVTKKPNGTIVLFAGRWKTVTTKDRINKELPAHVGITQKNYCWFIVRTNEKYEEIERVPFDDGIMITPDGLIVNPKDIPL